MKQNLNILSTFILALYLSVSNAFAQTDLSPQETAVGVSKDVVNSPIMLPVPIARVIPRPLPKPAPESVPEPKLNNNPLPSDTNLIHKKIIK